MGSSTHFFAACFPYLTSISWTSRKTDGYPILFNNCIMFYSGWLMIFATIGSNEDPFQCVPPDQRLDSKSGLLSEFCVIKMLRDVPNQWWWFLCWPGWHYTLDFLSQRPFLVLELQVFATTPDSNLTFHRESSITWCLFFPLQ